MVDIDDIDVDAHEGKDRDDAFIGDSWLTLLCDSFMVIVLFSVC